VSQRGRNRKGRAREEFEHFVAEWAGSLLRSAYLVVWDHGEAEDLVQECLFRMARRWPRVRSMDHPQAYARKVLINLALDESRQRSRHRSELHGPATDGLEEHPDEAATRVLGRVEASADLVYALSALPPRQRAAVVLRYFDDLTEAQAAEAMGCSVGTVKSTTARALERLREGAPQSLETSSCQNSEGSTVR
jgi:RNA polymerase sigma-70 factor (sigma-E family)